MPQWARISVVHTANIAQGKSVDVDLSPGVYDFARTKQIDLETPAAGCSSIGAT